MRYRTWRPLGGALPLLPVMVLGSLGACHATPKKPTVPTTAPTTGWRPWALEPRRGAMPGDGLVFVTLGHPRHGDRSQSSRGTRELKSLSVTASFGAAAAACLFDTRTHRHVCRVPANAAPKRVPVRITINGRSYPLGHYTYTSPGKQDLPLLKIRLRQILARARLVRRLLPSRALFGAVLKKTEPFGALGRHLARQGRVDYLIVSKLHDGIALRRAGVKKPIMILFVVEPGRAVELLHYDLEPAAVSLRWVTEATRALRGTPGKLRVHLWIDTGMGRQGVLPAQALPLARAIHQSPSLALRGIGTHLCCVTPLDLLRLKARDLRNQTALQQHRFEQTVQKIRAQGIGRKAILHAGASDVFRYRLVPLYYDLVRIGCFLLANPKGRPSNYVWKTRIRQVKTLPKGWCIDYRCHRRTQRVTRVALLAHIPPLDLAFVVRGLAAPVLLNHGHVVMLDITDIHQARDGDPVTLTFQSKRRVLESVAPTPVTVEP